jgi:Copper amine oxidase, enzyme domain/Copper amine oxidase, N2 domain
VDLSAVEADELFAFLYDSSSDFNLTRNPELTGWENVVRLVQVLQPNKSDVVQYLDESGSPPSRWAHIILNERTTSQKRVAEYMVGPLSNGESISAVPLTYCYNSGRNHINTAVGDTDGLLFGLAVTDAQLHFPWLLRPLGRIRPLRATTARHRARILQPTLLPLATRPAHRFAHMLDDESIEQEDLMVYFNLGNHRVPTTQDVPNTLMHTSGSGVMFVPFNYFDRDVSRETVSGVRIDVEHGVRRFGGHIRKGN